MDYRRKKLAWKAGADIRSNFEGNTSSAINLIDGDSSESRLSDLRLISLKPLVDTPNRYD
jgi:hypothetical protein